MDPGTRLYLARFRIAASTGEADGEFAPGEATVVPVANSRPRLRGASRDRPRAAAAVTGRSPMNDYAQMIVARDRMEGYLREADRHRLARIARAATAPSDAAEGERPAHPAFPFTAPVRLRELRRAVLRRLLGDAATA
jgi:hypothetical protein